MKYVFYIADRKMFRFDTDTQKSVEIKSPVLEEYRTRVLENAKRKEWKTNGTGAHFTSEGAPEISAEAAVQNIRSSINALSFNNDCVTYSLSIDDICGIYIHSNDSPTDGILISDSHYRYTHFDENSMGETVVCSEFAGEKHIGIIKKGRNGCSLLTEGQSRECWPSWSEADSDRIIYSGCGLALTQKDEEYRKELKSYPQMVLDQYYSNSYIEGPYSVYSLDLGTMELEELITDDSQKFSYIKPRETRDGYIYYIKRPYTMAGNQKRSAGDILMAPFRFLGAIGGFMNFFTMKYSGKTLTNSGASKAKQRSEAQMFIDGNLFDAEKEIMANQKEGDKFPGAVSRAYELCRRAPNGKEEIIKKGVIAYAVSPNGEIICSNGTHLLKLTPDGKGFREELLLKEKAVSFIYV